MQMTGKIYGELAASCWNINLLVGQEAEFLLNHSPYFYLCRELLSGFNVRQHRDASEIFSAVGICLPFCSCLVKKHQQLAKEKDTKYVSNQAMRPINFTSPEFGRRLAVFEPLDPQIKVMPAEKRNLSEVSKKYVHFVPNWRIIPSFHPLWFRSDVYP